MLMQSTTTLLFLAMGVMFLSFLLSLVFFCVWIYQDAKLHGQSPALWVLICVFASPILALILYLAFARKQELVACQNCQAPIPQSSRYCENCGAPNALRDAPRPRRKMSGMLKAAIGCMAAFILSLLLIIGSLMVVTFRSSQQAAQANAIPGQSTLSIQGASDVNTGWVLLSMENHAGGVWNFSLNKSSEGYHMTSRFDLDDPDTRTLMVQSECTGGPLTLELLQNDVVVEEYDLSQASGETQSIPLSGLDAGRVYLRLVNDGATHISGAIWVE